MKTAVVYRVVNENGTGPYYGTALNFVPGHKVYKRNRQPMPNDDRQLMLELKSKTLGVIGDKTHQYGFRSKKQLFAWFYEKPVRDKMQHLGFKIKKFRVPVDKVALGESQVIFNRKSAELIDTLHFSQL